MSKRKAGLNDIIYELDNDDIEISSDDEARDAKKHRTESAGGNKIQQDDAVDTESIDVINLDSTAEGDCIVVSPTKSLNGGKTSPDVSITNEEPKTVLNSGAKSLKADDVGNNKKVSSDCSNAIIFNEDIVIDSPASNSDLGVVGCENRTPLVTVRFKDKKMAKACKAKVKAFMLNLMKLHDEENLTGSETETDLELDVWPEDLLEETIEESKQPADNLFFVDTAPGELEMNFDVPTYRQNAAMISNNTKKEVTPPPSFRRGPSCFNCDGAHNLRDCHLPRNNMRINEKRKQIVRVGRYHVEDDQKFGHLVPGRISGQLRHALGLKRHELPMYIYRMRVLGYPPGWLEEARIQHSGITMFDSTGQAIQDPEEEDGEVCEPGSKDKFDIKKILDFPGFNVPPSSRYKEEAHLFGLPPMSEQDSKMAMLQMLAPNAMKAYKRKKLTMFPSASNNNSLQEGQAEMELDSGDEIAEFPSVPPLPDEAPPPPPPPPDSPPPPPPGTDDPSDVSEADDVEVVEVIRVNDIPVPTDDLIVIDEEQSQSDSGRDSPSLDDLEKKKQKLLNALQGDGSVASLDVSSSDVETETQNKNDEAKIELDKEATRKSTSNIGSPLNVTNTPKDKAGIVKSSEFGTPVMNIASSYTKLPTDDKFAKDICDVINFENLPNSTGKYKQISSLLKKVKSEVDRIQES